MQYTMYIGGYGEKSLAHAVLEDGEIRILERMNALNHSYLALNGETLYAVSETPNGNVLSYSVREDKTLEQTGIAPCGGDDPCHVCVAGQTLLVSNYTSGSLARFALKGNGKIGAALPLLSGSGSGPKRDRQEHSHIHFSARTPGGWVAVSDLGADSVLFFPFAEIGNDSPEPITVRTPSGYGPRHLAFSKKSECWYVICELESELLIYHGSPTQARLIGRMPIGGLGANDYPAALRFSGNGNMLAASVRGENLIVLYAVNANGMLSQLSVTPCRGLWPRDVCFTPDGKYLVCANQKSNSLCVFEVLDGRLRYKSQAEFEAPSCVVFREE